MDKAQHSQQNIATMVATSKLIITSMSIGFSSDFTVHMMTYVNRLVALKAQIDHANCIIALELTIKGKRSIVNLITH